MNIIVNIDKNTLANKQPKIYDLGEVTTSIQDLLDNSTITITNDRLVILRFTDLDLSVKQGFLNLNNYTEGDKYGLGQNILESDLIYFTSGGSGDSRPYKVYTALLTQKGTDAPVATVLENTLGEIIWSREIKGIYTGTLLNTFIEDKTHLVLTNNTYTLGGYPSYNSFDVKGTDSVRIVTTEFPENIDGNLYNTPIEIRVYN